MITQADKCHQFADLHTQPDAFIIANPWDIGSALILQGLGFKALATTSGGFAFTLGQDDGAPSLAQKLEHCRSIASATRIPVNADFEDGYATNPQSVAQNVEALIATGVAGCSIEDFDRQNKKLYDLSEAVERLSAALEVAAKLDFPFTVTARAEHLLRAGQDLDEVVTRLQAYEAAGADVLYAPGITSLEDLRTITSAINKPFNMLGVTIPNATLQQFQEAGAQRVSIGGALTYAAAKPIIEFGESMLNEGSFAWTSNMASGRRISELFHAESDD
ncbi:MAG: isocitrate lyase/phosphoenolpyruvate mutase family protein [Pseudomonadota bacterium]